MAKQKRVFDPRLKMDAVHGMMPHEFCEIISNNLLEKWKNENWKGMVGYDYYNSKQLDVWNLNAEYHRLKQSVRKMKAEHELLSIINKSLSGGKQNRELLYNNRREIVECVERNKKHLNAEKSAGILGIHYRMYYFWKSTAKGKCEHTQEALCKKKQPTRVTKEEEFQILKLLQDPRYNHYPLRSLIWKAHYEGIVHASPSVWKRVSEQYKVKREKPKRKRRKYKSLKAEYANQFLHADITFFKVLDKTYYIYIVKDNYSKYIKAWTIADAISSDIRLETFKSALRDVEISENGVEVTFITDRGKENKNGKVAAYFDTLGNVNILYAKQDIPYSNAMVERFNHDLKYMYLYRDKITTLKELKRLVEFAINEHNNIKRMESLHGQTPMEVYFNLPEKTEWIKAEWSKTRGMRRKKVNNIVCCIPPKG